jgi:hypothetical protein
MLFIIETILDIALLLLVFAFSVALFEALVIIFDHTGDRLKKAYNFVLGRPSTKIILKQHDRIKELELLCTHAHHALYQFVDEIENIDELNPILDSLSELKILMDRGALLFTPVMRDKSEHWYQTSTTNEKG